MQVAINRQLLGLEDILFGTGTVTQTRGGESVVITKLNAANLPFDETKSLKTVLESLTWVTAVADNILSVNTVGTNINAVNTVAAAAASINTSTTHIQEIIDVAASIDKVIITANHISNVDIVGTDLSLASYSNILDNGLLTDPVSAPGTGLSIIENVSDNIVAITGVYNKLNDVNAFFNTYYIETIAPTIISHPSLSEGDLWYDTVTLRLFVYTGATWLLSYAGTIDSDIMSFTNKTIDSITNNVGADHIHYKVRNASGVTIPINTVVTASGTQPGTDYIQVIPVTDPQTQIVIGVVHTELLNNGTGLVVNTGVHNNMDTSTWPVGTVLYPNTSGGFTNVKPTTGRYQACAIVLRQHVSSGTMLVEFTEPKQTTAAIVQDMNNISFTLDLGGII